MIFRLKALSERITAPTEPDAELLARFVTDRDEVAFAVVVERYGPMVLGVCRRALGDHNDAEDAFQAAFLVLARKAHTCPAPLAGWLYGVARRVALKARSKRPEPLTHDVQGRGRDPLAEASAREAQALLDDEIQRLPADQRLPVVLCYLDGLTLDEAAARLGCSRGALRGRLERGRDRLRSGLRKRGLAPALALATIPRIATASALPPGLGAATARAAVTFVFRTGPVPIGPRLLAEGVIRAMLATKLRLAVAVLAAALTVPVLLSAPTGAPPVTGGKAAEPPKENGGVSTGAGGAGAAPRMMLVGSWRVTFANGVEERCSLKADRSAAVWEPRRQSAGKIEVRDAGLVVFSDDGRVERWTPVGGRAVVEHWAALADYPDKKPVVGIAEAVHAGQGEGRQDPNQTAEQSRRESRALLAAKTLVDAMRPARADLAGGLLRECIDPRYVKEHNLQEGALPIRRVATGAVLSRSLVDPQTVFVLVETDEAEKEVWLLRVVELDGKAYIVPPRPPDRDTKTFAPWIFRWKL